MHLFRKQNLLLFSLALLAFFSELPAAHADGAYRWKDSQGRDHFGSNPPKDAMNLQSLSGRSFSRYSSEKLLKPLKSIELAEQVKEQEALQKIEVTEPKNAKAKQATARASIREENLVAELEQGALEVKHDAEKRVTDCQVTVKNPAAIPATNVLVSFEFEDGTLIPGKGPDTIDADSSAKYIIPEEMLPVTVKAHSANDQGPKPKVSIKAAGAE